MYDHVLSEKSVPVDFDPFESETLVEQARTTDPQREIFASIVLGHDASRAYNLTFDLTLEGELDVEALEKALRELIRRHDALRTTFSADGLTLVVSDECRLPIKLEDLNSGSPSPDHRLAEITAEEVGAPFDLLRGPLVRARLCKTGPLEHHLILTTHHIVCDGWSVGVLFSELAALYAAASRGTQAELLPAPSFAAFARARAADTETRSHSEAVRYWMDRFQTIPPALELPLSRTRPAVRTYHSGCLNHRLDGQVVGALRRLGARNGATLYSTLLASFQAFLARITGVEDIVVGLFAAGQAHYGMDGLVGHCVNLLPLRCRVPAEAPFAQILRDVCREQLDAQEHQSLTFGALLQRLRLPRDVSRIPLVPVAFNLDRIAPSVPFGTLRASMHAVPRGFETFECFINAIESSGYLNLECTFNLDLFDTASIQRLMTAYSVFLDGIVEAEKGQVPGAGSSLPISQLPLLTDDTRKELVFGRGGSEEPSLFRGSFLAWVCEQVERTPEAVAVTDESGESWTYEALWAYASRVAAGLSAEGVTRGELVGVMLERGAPMLGVLLGVLRHGAAYLPLDPDFPEERLAYMVEDGGVALVIADQSDSELGAVRTVSPQSLAGHRASDQKGDLPVSEDLAYVIYTSGSTGRPKGVEITHGALRNFLGSMRDEPGLAAGDSLLAVTTLSFDISGLELFLPLCVGARVIVASREVASDGYELLERLNDSGATVMQATPATWRMLIDAGWSGGLRKVLCGGEALPEELSRELVGRADEVWNLYGPTETTIWSTLEHITGEGPVTVGRPIANTRVYVLDRHGHLVPDGVHGEIWIAGAGVARGYHARAELTAERFRDDPFVAGERMYRTGDLGRWRTDGRLEHLGRLDFQVKVHGYRIELGEIESALEALDEVRQAVVVARGDAEDRRLVAYVIFEAGQELLAGEIRRHLGETLPRYMVPGLVVPLEAFPLTPNGKVDRNALPDPLGEALEQREYEPPQGDIEQAIAQVWAEVLEIEQVGRHDNFFELGGHSLLAISSVSQVEKRIGLVVDPRALFFRTLAQLASSAVSDSGVRTRVAG
jgi:amino acid adenylation domain-containing protein